MVEESFHCNPLKLTDDGQIKNTGRNSEQSAVEAVQHAAVPGDDVAGVLDVAHAFPLGLEQVAEHAGHVHDGRKDDDMEHRIGPQPRPVQDEPREDGEQHAAPEARPGLFRGDGGEKLAGT